MDLNEHNAIIPRLLAASMNVYLINRAILMCANSIYVHYLGATRHKKATVV